MRKLAFLLLFFDASFTTVAQERYLDSLFSEITKSIYTYKDTLQLDIYSAQKGSNTERPLLLVVHGGGFMGGIRDSKYEAKFSRAMAAKGYLVASMDYRLTLQGKSFGCDCPAKSKIETFRNATEDIVDAFHFVSQIQNLTFNHNKVILIGSSAGAEAVLNTAFLQDHYSFADLFDKPIKIAGVISLAGAMVNSDYIIKNNAVPTLFIHGQKDSLVPYATAPHHYCAIGNKGYLMLNGPKTMVARLKALNTSYLLAYAPSGNHEWSNLGYAYTQLIAEFINEAVLKGKLVQTEIDIEHSNEN